MKISTIKFFGVVLITALLSCTKEETSPIEYLDFKTDKSSSESSLHVSDDGDLYLSWVESDSVSAELKFATLDANDKWSTPTTIASGNDWFVNWADFPSLQTFGNNIAAHYLAKSAEDTYAYNVNLIISNDKGKTWQKAFVPHTDSTHTEHGFVSKLPLNENELFNVWLDGRQYAAAEQDSTIVKEMTLRAAAINEQSELVEEYLLDARVCDCCQTGTAMTNKGPIVVYRDRSENEIRDIYYVRQVNGSWTEPKPIYNDNWHIAGCPVNGPSIDAKDDTVAIAWFSMNNGMSEVKVSFSMDNGVSFNSPIKVNYTNPLGRIDVLLIDETTALVSWMDMVNKDTIILAQKIAIDGSKSLPFELAKSSENRSSGFPRIALNNNHLYASWTDTSENTSQIKIVKVNIEYIK